MSTPVVDIEIKRGDTKRHLFIVSSKNESGVLAPVDISLWTLFIIAVNPDSEPSDITDEVGTIEGQFVVDGKDGQVYFSPPGTWDIGDYYYDMQALDANAEKCTVVEGKYKIVQDVAKD